MNHEETVIQEINMGCVRCGGVGWVRDTRSRTHPTPHTTLYTAHINLLYNFPQDSCTSCWKTETCSCTLDSNVNTPLPSNKQVVLD